MSEEDTPMDDDALVNGWDAYVTGRDNGLDRLDSQDREVIEMLHARTCSPSPRQSFASDLRTRLTAGSTGDQLAAPTAPRSLVQSPAPVSRPGAWRAWQRVAIAAVLIAALLASIGGRLADDLPAPTVQAPVAQVTADSLGASPVASPPAGWAACTEFTDARPFGKPVFIDAARSPELRAPLASARNVTIQQLRATESGDVTPNSYFTSGVTGVVIDTVVVGAARMRLTAPGNTMIPGGVNGDMGGQSVAPLQWVDVLQGDTLIYPAGALETLSNTQGDRDLLILRVVLHDVGDLLSGGVSDTVTLTTTGTAALPDDLLPEATAGFAITLDYVSYVLRRELPTAPCDGGGRYLLTEALELQQTERGPRLFGLLVWVQPLTLPDQEETP